MDDVIALASDLFFQSRILSAGRHAGRSVRFVSHASSADRFALALVDLDASADVLKAIATWAASGAGPIIAFGPHVDTEGRRAARRAGAGRVLAKSRFVTQLPTILANVSQDRPEDNRHHDCDPPDEL